MAFIFHFSVVLLIIAFIVLKENGMGFLKPLCGNDYAVIIGSFFAFIFYFAAGQGMFVSAVSTMIYLCGLVFASGKNNTDEIIACGALAVFSTVLAAFYGNYDFLLSVLLTASGIILTVCLSLSAAGYVTGAENLTLKKAAYLWPAFAAAVPGSNGDVFMAAFLGAVAVIIFHYGVIKLKFSEDILKLILFIFFLQSLMVIIFKAELI